MSERTFPELAGDNGHCPDTSGLSPEELLPHRDTMLLVEKILAVGETGAVTRSRVVPSWPLAGEDGVSPLVLVELAAQTAGVYNSWKKIRRQGRDCDKNGWLVAVKKAAFHTGTLPFGMDVTTRSHNTMETDNLVEVTSRLCCGDTPLAEVILQIYQP
ncbi:MAG: hypothetical protein ACK5PS_01460 [Desulfopila sp.]